MLAKQLRVQRLGVDEWQLWRALRVEALTEAPEAFCATLAQWQGPGDVEERWRARLTTVPLNLIAFLDGEPAGIVSATVLDERSVSELISLWVAPAGRGQGVGEALIAAVLAWARTQDAVGVGLGVREGNAAAIALYSRNGFVDEGGATLVGADGAGERRLIRRLRGGNESVG
jgi:ribosomal protein S18 acetylase RimI-like enzyme